MLGAEATPAVLALEGEVDFFTTILTFCQKLPLYFEVLKYLMVRGLDFTSSPNLIK